MMRRFVERLARGCHAVLLRLAPKDVRNTYGTQMRDTFAEQVAAARSMFAIPVVALREANDLWRARRGTDATTNSSGRWLPIPPGLWRGLRRRPGYALAVIATLGLGTAGTTTLFSIVDTVFISPLPFPDADRLVTVAEASPKAPGQATLAAPARIDDWHRLNTTMVGIAASYSENVTDTSGVDPERLDTRRVTPRFFEVFGMAPLAGRTFTADEEVFGGPGAAVLSETFWRRRFAGDARAVGQRLTIGGRPYTIVGVMPRAFSAAATDAWLPAQIHPSLMGMRDARFVSGVGRLKPDVSIEQARADLDRVQQQLGDQFPATDAGWTAVLADLKAARVGSGRTLWLIFAAVGLVWLIGVANVASLVIVQVQRRTREFAIRAALGSSRRQLIAHVGTEVLILALAGGGLGLVAASWAVAAMPSLFEALPRQNELGLDTRAVLFTLSVSVAAAVACGMIPAILSTRGVTDVGRAGRGTVVSSHWTQRGLVVLQVAFGVVLCASAGLLVGSYLQLTQEERGFSTDGVLTFHVGARWDEDREQVGRMQIALLERLAAMPGVTSAGFVNFLPSPGGSLRYQVEVDGLANSQGERALSVGARMVAGGYFKALNVSLIAGEGCGAMHTDPERPRTALVNEQFVETYAGGGSVIGRQLRVLAGMPLPYTIAGVVPNLAEDGVHVARAPFVYTCDQAGAWPDPNYVVRSADTSTLAAQLRSVVREVDPSRAVFELRPLESAMRDAIAEPRQQAGLVSAFALTALLLTALGLYALLARMVADTRREIGVRLALGASRSHVVRLIAGHASLLLAVGFAAGIGLTVLAYRALHASLFGAVSGNAGALAAIVGTLVVVCAVAVVVPALRASRVDPTEALAGD
ncbi:MAG: hypothetical protein AMXMBFR57_00550 [Acidimicrobiia bacterium]|jgi:predicted permease